MEEVLKNAGLFLDILGMSKTNIIQQWDSGAFQKAFKWATYFEQVYQKLNGRGKLKEQLVSYLEDQTKASMTTGCYPLSFEDLQNSSKILRENILQNIWCTSGTYLNLIETFYKDTERQSAAEIFQQDLGALIRLRYLNTSLNAAGQSLLGNHEQTTNDHLKRKTDKQGFKSTGNLNDDEAFSGRVKSRLLRDRVSNCLENLKSLANLERKMDHLTSTTRGDMILLGAYQLDLSENQMSTASALNDSKSRHGKFQSFILKYIKEKLVPKWRTDTARFLHLPASKVIEIAILSDEFASLYIATLRCCCQSYDLEFGIDGLLLQSRSNAENSEKKVARERWKNNLKFHFEQLHLHESLKNFLRRFAVSENEDIESNEQSLLKIGIWDEMTQSLIQ